MTLDQFFAQSRLSAYMDGDLPENEAAELAAALLEQPRLRRQLSDMRRAVAFLERHGPVAAPRPLHSTVMAHLARRRARVFLLGRLRRTLLLFPFLPRRWLLGGFVLVLSLCLASAWLRSRVEGDHGNALADTANPPALFSGPGLPYAGSASSQASDSKAATTVAEVPLPDQGFEPTPSGPGSPAQIGGSAPSADSSHAPRDKPPTFGSQATKPHSVNGSGAGSPAYSGMGGTRPPTAPSESQPAPSAAVATPVDSSAEASRGVEVLAFRLYPTRSDVLWDLFALAQELGGSVLGPSGSVLRPFVLDVEQNHARVVFLLPPGTLTYLEQGLKKLGGLSEAEPGVSSPIGDVRILQVQVELLYQP